MKSSDSHQRNVLLMRRKNGRCHTVGMASAYGRHKGCIRVRGGRRRLKEILADGWRWVDKNRNKPLDKEENKDYNFCEGNGLNALCV